jgi:hypothetical protein
VQAVDGFRKVMLEIIASEGDRHRFDPNSRGKL